MSNRTPSWRLAAALALTASIGAAGIANAQLNPFRGANGVARLQQSDQELIEQTAHDLYTRPEVADGTSVTWKNPQTGASGSVTKEADFNTDFQGRSLACRRLRYEIAVPSQQGISTLRLSWCNDGGTWRLL